MDKSPEQYFNIIKSFFYILLEATPAIVKDKFIDSFNKKGSSSWFSISSLDDYKLVTNLNNPEFQEKQFSKK